MPKGLPTPGRGPGAGLVDTNSIVALLIVQIAMAVSVTFGMLNTFPSMPLQAVTAAQTTGLEHEKGLLQVMALAGALGGLLHSIRSFVWYVGNRDLRWSWIPTYLTIPVTGSLIAVVFYLVIRAGFVGLGGQAAPNYTGFAGAGALIGLFQAAAILKLKEVSETLLTKPQAGADTRPQGSTDQSTSGGPTGVADSSRGLTPMPVVTSASAAKQNGTYELVLEGTGFRETSELFVDGVKVPIATHTPKRISTRVMNKPSAVYVVNPGAGQGKTVQVRG